MQGGSGQRLDGKAPSPLKDKDGTTLDVREVRAKAAKERAAEEARKDAETGRKGPGTEGSKQPQRKSLVGNKFSKKKTSAGQAFTGGGNTL